MSRARSIDEGIVQSNEKSPIKVFSKQMESFVEPKTPTLITKKFTYHVYSGNYPKQIERALVARGVWKPFDKVHAAARRRNLSGDKSSNKD